MRASPAEFHLSKFRVDNLSVTLLTSELNVVASFRAQKELLATIDQLRRETQETCRDAVAAELQAHSKLQDLCSLLGYQEDVHSPDHVELASHM